MADKVIVVPKDEPIRRVEEPEQNGKRSPEGWFAECGPKDASIHAACAQLHGWNHHKLHTTDVLLLTRAQYEAALAGVETFTRHADAVSPYAPKG